MFIVFSSWYLYMKKKKNIYIYFFLFEDINYICRIIKRGYKYIFGCLRVYS